MCHAAQREAAVCQNRGQPCPGQPQGVGVTGKSSSKAGDERGGGAWSRGHTRLQWPVGHVRDRPVPG